MKHLILILTIVSMTFTLNVIAQNSPIEIYGGLLDGSTYEKTAIYSDDVNHLLFEAPFNDTGDKLNYHFNWRGGGLDAMTILGSNSNVGIGTNSPEEKLQVAGTIKAGPGSTSGGIMLAQNYDTDNIINSLSSNHSSGNFIMGFGAAGKPNAEANTLMSTFDNFPSNKAALRIGAGTLEFLSTTSAIITPVGDELITESRFYIGSNGNVGIGTTAVTDNYKLSVEGEVRARGIQINATNWADYVFEEDYYLAPLTEVKKYIEANKHLPNVPSEKEVTANGINLGEMDAILLRKIEELTLYILAQENRIKDLEKN